MQRKTTQMMTRTKRKMKTKRSISKTWMFLELAGLSLSRVLLALAHPRVKRTKIHHRRRRPGLMLLLLLLLHRRTRRKRLILRMSNWKQQQL
jgi:hypothetical protein